ncbi:hypothetical protein BDV18DRAFT_133651 [Aspergillus unguis]
MRHEPGWMHRGSLLVRLRQTKLGHICLGPDILAAYCHIAMIDRGPERYAPGRLVAG